MKYRYTLEGRSYTVLLNADKCANGFEDFKKRFVGAVHPTVPNCARVGERADSINRYLGPFGDFHSGVHEGVVVPYCFGFFSSHGEGTAFVDRRRKTHVLDGHVKVKDFLERGDWERDCLRRGYIYKNTKDNIQIPPRTNARCIAAMCASIFLGFPIALAFLTYQNPPPSSAHSGARTN